MGKASPEALDDHVSSAKAAEIFDSILKHHDTREYIISIVEAHLNGVPFMKKVREYASDEINARMFTSFKYWLLTALSAAVSGLVGITIARIFHLG